MSVNTAERTFVETHTLNGNYHLSIQQSEEPLGLSDIFVMRHTRDESLLRELSSIGAEKELLFTLPYQGVTRLLFFPSLRLD